MKQLDNRIESCNNLEEVDNLLKTYTKEFHIFLDTNINFITSTYNLTKYKLDEGVDKIYTTQIVFLSFDLIRKGYRIYVHNDGKCLEFKPYMNYIGQKEIRLAHNIRKLFLCGHFNEDLGL